MDEKPDLSTPTREGEKRECPACRAVPSNIKNDKCVICGYNPLHPYERTCYDCEHSKEGNCGTYTCHYNPPYHNGFPVVEENDFCKEYVIKQSHLMGDD